MQKDDAKCVVQAEFQGKIQTLAEKLHNALPAPDEKASYELIGIGKIGILIATELQSILSTLWQNPIGLSIIVPKPKANAKTSWHHTCIECNPKFHTRKILVDAVVYTGKTCKELMEIYPNANFASLYALKEFPNCHFAEKIDKDFKLNFLTEMEEN
jgi:pyrimidine operon attenuation protein/uracil phosphoribosyltransferase